MRAGGFDFLERQLFAQQYPDLHVTARRRKFNSQTGVIAAGATGYVNCGVQFDAADNLQEGDGVLIDFLIAGISGNQVIAVPGTLLQGARARWVTASGLIGPQPFASVKYPANASNLLPQNIQSALPLVFTPEPSLWTTRDINFILRQVPAPVPQADQPLFISVQVWATNNLAAANTVQIDLTAFYRIVRGLQEG